MRYLKNRLRLLLLFYLVVSQAVAQTDTLAYVFQDAIENTVANDDDNPFEFDTEFEHLQDFVKHPLSINKASTTDFEQLRLLTSEQIQAIIAHREQYGAYLTVYELQAVLDMAVIRRILPFIFCEGSLDDYQVPVREWFRRGQHTFFSRYGYRLEKDDRFLKPYASGGFIGDGHKVYLRHRFTFGTRLSYGFLIEKDAGESWRPDFLSVHFKINHFTKNIQTLCLGDFAVSLGQGLIHHNGFNIGKSALVLAIEKNTPPIRHYSSSNETDFMRGAAIQARLSRATEGVFFVSYRRRDANRIEPLPTDPTDTEATVSALQFTGLHRTRAELEDKNTLGIVTIGGRMKCTTRRGHWAANAVFNQTDKRFNPRDKPYNQFAFKGRRLANISLDYKQTFKNFHLFGETAASNNGGWATLNGALIGLDKKLSMSILQRLFSINYQNFNAQPFAETSRARDERGVYFGAEYRPSRAWMISAYADFWQHKWWRFRADAPSAGHAFFLKLDHRRRATEGYVQLRLRTKQENATRPDTAKVNSLADKTKWQIRLHYQYRLSTSLEMRNRAEWAIFNENTFRSKGFLAWQDVLWSSSNQKLTFSGRIALFDTDDYDSAIYAFENDLLYNFTVLPYYAQGLRMYFNAGFKINKSAFFEARVSRTAYSRPPINHPERTNLTDIKMQCRWMF